MTLCPMAHGVDTLSCTTRLSPAARCAVQPVPAALHGHLHELREEGRLPRWPLASFDLCAPVDPSDFVGADAHARARAHGRVIVTSHFPMYTSATPLGSALPANPDGTGAFAQEAWWTAEQCEYEGHRRNCSVQPRQEDGPSRPNKT